VKNVVKIALISSLLLLVAPQVTFAAWWNPLTWSLFRKQINTQLEPDETKEFNPIEHGAIPVTRAENKREPRAQPDSLDESMRIINEYKESQGRSQDIRSSLETEWLKLRLQYSGYDGIRYSGTYRTDSDGDGFYSDNQGNFIRCHTDMRGITSCGDVQ
jgi:hypothetical protein